MNHLKKSDQKEEFILSIDFGTTNLKVAIFNNKLEKISNKSTPVIYSKNNDKIEFDVKMLWESLLKIIKDVCRENNIGTNNIDIVSVTSQNVSFTIIDKNGKPKIPFISWLDKRAEEESEILIKRFNKDLSKHCGVNSIGPQSFLAKVLWIKNKSGLSLDREDLICPMPGFFTYKLTGVNYMCQNLASLYDNYSVVTNDWRKDMIDFVGIKKSQLPLIVKTGASISIKKSPKGLELNKDSKIVLAGNDQTANAVGNLLFGNEILISIGTAMIIYTLRGKDKGPFNSSTIWGPYINNNYYEMFASDYGTYSFDRAVKNICGEIDFDRFTLLAKQYFMNNNKSRSIFFYPHYIDSKKAWIGNGDNSERALAVFEGMGFFIKYILEKRCKIDYKAKSIYISGGGSKNIFLLEIIASILNVPISQSIGDALLGAAIIAKNKRVNRGKIIVEKILPDQKLVSTYKDLYKKWLKDY